MSAHEFPHELFEFGDPMYIETFSPRIQKRFICPQKDIQSASKFNSRLIDYKQKRLTVFSILTHSLSRQVKER